jgi:hypothetical protein
LVPVNTAPLIRRARVRIGLNALVAAMTCFVAVARAGGEPPAGYWPSARSRAILDRTQTVRLAPALGDLTPGERTAVARLIEAGGELQRVYEDSRHPQALASFEALARLHAATGTSAATGDLLDLYRLFQGPIATTLDNQRLPFLPVGPYSPNRNVYPPGMTREELQRLAGEARPGAADLLAGRTVVRAATAANLDRDLAVLSSYPVLDALHPGLGERLRALRAGPESRAYAIPQSVRWPAELTAASRLLSEAADAVEADDAEFAGYLRNRARDLLSDDYESGDASWVTGRFRRLNAQIGAYETYDDSLFGAKAFMSMSLLKRDLEASERLQEAIGNLQAIEDALPYQPHRRVRDEVPIGVYEVIADFGQARGANTATILPNDPLFTRRYGRTILLRENVLRDAALFANSKVAWDAVVAPEFAGDLTQDGDLHRTLWHEIGHYLGPDRDRQGNTLDLGLGAMADSYEEMKSDLIALHTVPALRLSGYYDEAGARAVYAGGIRRVLQKVEPRRDQPYQTMQLMQFNWFLAHGLLSFDRKTKRLGIEYGRYGQVVGELLAEVLAIQQSGDQARAAAFMDRWTEWRRDLHEVLARRMRDSARYRYVLVRYGALGE